MPKTLVTQQLADSIKMIRQQNNIQSKAVAEHVGKSSAYISRLEKGEIKSIDSVLLDKILEYICGDNIESGEIVSVLYDTLTIRYSKEEIDKQIWLMNYDMIARRVPIPEELVKSINEMMESYSISRPHLLERINANESLTAEEISDSSIEYNRWYSKDDGKKQIIKMKLEMQDLDVILDKKARSSPYIIILSILYYILKIAEYGDDTDLSDNDNADLMEKATQILNAHKFYSIAEKNKILKTIRTEQQYNELLSTFDIENSNIISDIIAGFKYASETDVQTANSRLKAFDKNLRWDIWFILRIISLNYQKLDDLSTTLKREFIHEIEELINTYHDIPDDKKKMEVY